MYCAGCGDHVLTMARNALWGDMVQANMFDPKAGQGPWKFMDVMACRKCYEPFGNLDGIWKPGEKCEKEPISS